MTENKSRIETKRIKVEENIVLKKENRDLRDRSSIYERVLDQILRDQEDKRMQISKTEEWFTQKKSERNLKKEYARRPLILLHATAFKSCLNMTVKNQYMIMKLKNQVHRSPP